MIQVTRFNGSRFFINAERIISIESTPDTVITMQENVKLIVKDKPEEIVKRIIEYQRLIHNLELRIDLGE
jgi:flagellar protein FlbD